MNDRHFRFLTEFLRIVKILSHETLHISAIQRGACFEDICKCGLCLAQFNPIRFKINPKYFMKTALGETPTIKAKTN